MRILFCKVSCMKYYKGASDKDIPYNGGSYVDEHGYGHEEYNFEPVDCEDGKTYCLGFVETKSTSKSKINELHIENISGCELLKNDEFVEDVLVVWCATTDLNETSVVGWYKNATVFRNYEEQRFDNGYIQHFNVIAEKNNCVLLPEEQRHRHIWDAPVAKKRMYGFGQSLIWYAKEEKAQNYISKLVKNIDEYSGDNWVDLVVD
ncbi:MAG TPA: hypothetical protein DIV40_09365 [Clostridiales bacterium]|nr:hypothetical protein [Clostridiales bacterium]